MTNYKKIKGMSVEELAEFLYRVRTDYEWGERDFANSWRLAHTEEWLESECDSK